MKNLEELVVAAKCRRGGSVGITSRGAYWFAGQPISTARLGGDGIGQNAPVVECLLELRHYRSGLVQAVIYRDAWHQNGEWSGSGDEWYSMPLILGCTSVEEVIAALRGSKVKCYSGSCEAGLTAALLSLGLLPCPPSPDEDPQAAGVDHL